MAWYYRTYSCGHEGRVNVVGPNKTREWKINKHFAGICEECLQIKREEENKKAALLAKEMDLVDLQGSEKQVGWANTLRNNLINKFEKYLSDAELSEDDKDTAQYVLDYILVTTNKASSYIDMRGLSIDELIKIFKDKASPSAIIQSNYEENMEEDFKIYPEKVTQPKYVRISYIDNKIKVSYEKNEQFRVIVKNLRYTYEKGSWVREINKTTGNYIDRIAELGNVLLANGFVVLISNEEAREKAKKGVFQEEHKRWIVRENDTTFKIFWRYRDDHLYRRAKSLPKSKYTNGVILVDVCYYLEVQDFANLYDFKFTDFALEIIENYKETIKNAVKVENIKVSTVKPVTNELQNILNSSREVLSDLIEEE